MPFITLPSWTRTPRGINAEFSRWAQRERRLTLLSELALVALSAAIISGLVYVCSQMGSMALR